MDENRFVHYKIGIPVLDNQHWMLFEKINEIKRNIKDGYMEEARTNIAILYEMMSDHIEHEEEMMLLCRFPYEKFHSLHHPNLLQIILDIIKLPDSILEKQFVIDDLRDAFATHIDQFDSQFKEYFDKCEKPE